MVFLRWRGEWGRGHRYEEYLPLSSAGGEKINYKRERERKDREGEEEEKIITLK